MPNAPEQDPRIYFAPERTLLAWIRTGLALMGFGFALARFGLFLRQMQASETHQPLHHGWNSPFTGVALMGLGVAVNIIASIQYAATVRQLREGSWIPGRTSRSAITLALLLAAIGIAAGAVLLFVN